MLCIATSLYETSNGLLDVSTHRIMPWYESHQYCPTTTHSDKTPWISYVLFTGTMFAPFSNKVHNSLCGGLMEHFQMVRIKGIYNIALEKSL